MKKVKVVPGHAEVQCPGCAVVHRIDLGLWEWDGGEMRPSFYPGLLFTDAGQICDAVIIDGQWHYSAVSTHQYAGQVVEVPGVAA